ncbi:MAG TPA: DUF4097 family beta strand repeat-containing protein [Pyrinomonadaceae bacterium]|jgi:hypothetical protein|nr:DUF4097 family beta strand repeat-containing protein [Pyrinomonadaceae bacterium]
MTNTQNQSGAKKSHLVLLLLVVGLAAFSSAMSDLNQLQSLTLETGRLIASWSEMVVPTASASSPVIANSCVPTFVPQNVSHSDEFRWSGNVPAGSSIEVKGISGEIVADAASGSEVQVVALKKARRGDVNSVHIKVEQHEGGVTICALYPDDEGEYSANCSGGVVNDSGRSEGSGNVRNNDVTVDFTVHVPSQVGFVGKTVNGGISVTSLSGNVVTRTVNGSIKISTTGYAEAATVNGEINARFLNGAWPKELSFKTVNGEINLDLPANLSATIDAKTFNGVINSDFPLNVIEEKGRKALRGTIGSGGRELNLKTLNGSINLRIAG